MSVTSTGSRAKHSRRPEEGRVNLKMILAMTDEEIERTSPPELANLPPDFWDGAVMMPPVSKAPISIRVDEDVLLWFRRLGAGYQTRMNTVLRAFMTAQQGKEKRAKRKEPSAKKARPKK